MLGEGRASCSEFIISNGSKPDKKKFSSCIIQEKIKLFLNSCCAWLKSGLRIERMMCNCKGEKNKRACVF